MHPAISFIGSMNFRNAAVASLVFWKVFCVLFSSETAEAETLDRNVFILHSYHQEYPWTKSQNDGFTSAFKGGQIQHNTSFSTEYLDTKRVKLTDEYQIFFRDYLRKKYDHYKPDVIFATDDDALHFLRLYKDSIFPDSPVIFSGINNTTSLLGLDRSSYTGVLEVKDIPGNINLIQRIFPETEKVFIVGDGSSTFKAIKNNISHYLDIKQSKLSIEFLTDTQFSVITQKLSTINSGLIILTTVGAFQDERGCTIPLDKVIHTISNTGQFILISMEDVYIQDGVLGGIVTSGAAQGATAAAAALRITDHKIPAADIAPVTAQNIPVFNYNMVQSLGIDVSQLPQDSDFLNKPFSVYDNYKAEIWATITAFITLLVLLLSLSLTTIRRRRAEEALAENERFLNSVIENIPDMIFVKDADDLSFVRFNKAAEEIVGISSAKMIGKNDFDFFPKHQAEFFIGKDREVLTSGLSLDIAEEEIYTPAGIRYLHTKKIPLFGLAGNPVYLLGISRDITSQKEAGEKRKELEERLRQAEKMESIGTLAGGIAHDFNNILSAIIGYSELARIEIENDPEKSVSFINSSLKGAYRAKELTRQILTFSRKSALRKIVLDPAEILTDAMLFLRSSLPSTVTIESDIQSGTTIFGDATQLHQIVLNLCTNAAQAMSEQGGTLGVNLKTVHIGPDDAHAHLRIPAGRYARIQVSDTGCGMDLETQQRMFDPYFTTKGANSGTGLGLAVVHGIVKSHNGYIHVYSEPNEGTSIHVYLPLHDDGPVNTSAPMPSEVTISGGNEHILLVDDEVDIINMTRDLLVRFGYKVTAFSNGTDALAALQQGQNTFDLLLTDMTMPGITGAELAAEAIKTQPVLPVILCTGHSEMINREDAISMGIREYCEKPLAVDDLLKAIRTVLDK
jgi:PAS domain S-box-containing protein